MDLSPALGWQPHPGWQRFTVVESHAGGEPFRVVVEGLPEIPGQTMLDRRRYATENLDHIRRALTWEPRGHSDMYGGWIGDPTDTDSDISVLFVHNEGFSTMCGHGIIALTKVVLDTGILPTEGTTSTIRIDTPAGQIVASAETSDGRTGRVTFANVASFAPQLDAVVSVPGLGEVEFDVGFGGAFYAYVKAGDIGLDLADGAGLIAAGRSIKGAIGTSMQIEHPDNPELGFLYGVIFTGPPVAAVNHSRNVCVFADGEVDRSPTGTGVSGRLAILHARGEIEVGESVTIESIVGSTFTGRLASTTTVGSHPAVVPEISGRAHIVGRSELWIDPGDSLNPGFLLR